MQKGRFRGDKIFDNSYNQGTVEDMSNDPIVIDTEYKNTYLDAEYNMYDNYRIVELSNLMYDMLEKSEEFSFVIEPKNKNIKNKIPEISHFLLSAFNDTDYSFSEKFSCLCEVLNVREDLVYIALPMIYKSMAIEEASRISSVIRNKQKYRIF